MSAMDYDEAAAERLEAVYLGKDVADQRAHVMRLVDVQPGERVIDIGSGPGFLASNLADAVGPSGQVAGIDISKPLIARAQARTTQDWLTHQIGNAMDLPFDDASFDVAVSTQVAEYLPDPDAGFAEIARVLRPGGRGLIMATDWHAMSWYTREPDRMAQVLDAFAPHCSDTRLPQTLAPRLRKVGLTVEAADCYPIVNLSRYDGSYSASLIGFIAGYVRGQGTLPDTELDAWAAEQAALDDEGAYYFSTVRFSLLVSKPE